MRTFAVIGFEIICLRTFLILIGYMGMNLCDSLLRKVINWQRLEQCFMANIVTWEKDRGLQESGKIPQWKA